MDSDAHPTDPERTPRSLSVHGKQRRAPTRRLHEFLTRVEDGDQDTYGRGGAVARLEARMAEMLGKEAAVFMPTGAMASQVALRLHADARSSRTIGFHPRAHIEVHEQKGYEIVHQLHGRLLGDHDRLVTLEDLEAVREPLAAVLLELPQRDLGGRLPSWEELTAQTSWMRTRGIAAHLDGARLWEAQPFYGRPHAEIADLFDTVYVSLYKGLEGLSGAVLAGQSDLIDQARLWRARLGGQLHHAWPLAVSAEIGLDTLVPRMPAFWQHARELAAGIQGLPGVEVVPDPPQTPLFHVIVPVPPDALATAHQRFVERRGLELFLYPRPTTSPRSSRFEVTVGENAMAIEPEELREALAEIIEDAAG